MNHRAHAIQMIEILGENTKSAIGGYRSSFTVRMGSFFESTDLNMKKQDLWL